MDLFAAGSRIQDFAYQRVLKEIFFRMDPEDIHDLMTITGRGLEAVWPAKMLTGSVFRFRDKRLEQNVAGIRFENPVGLAAGFDKDALLTDLIPHVGFGFMEVGSITGEPCKGNPKPRLWRLKKSRAIVVYYGLKNEGCEIISKRLRGKRFEFPVGTSIAKTNSPDTVEVERGMEDYAKAYSMFTDIGSYSTINTSCPNACGGEPFSDPGNLDRLLGRIDGIPSKKPVFLKISPDLSRSTLDEVMDIAGKHRVAGFVCTNLTKKRDNPRILDGDVPALGGISGKVVEGLSDESIRQIRKRAGGRFAIIGCGGVFGAEDAYRKIRAGASLIQLFTGMIYEGPHLIGKINHGLVGLLAKDGFSSISEAVGTEKG
ncbi:MAG: quinone-dependent dihydroorotate dehydrogenase [Candidatus Micrarchaeota archaeon]